MPETVTPRSLDEILLELDQVETKSDGLAHRIAELAAYGITIDRNDFEAVDYRAASERISGLYDEMRAIRKTALAAFGAAHG